MDCVAFTAEIFVPDYAKVDIPNWQEISDQMRNGATSSIEIPVL